MDKSVPDNANPTILSASQLPTRKAKKAKQVKKTKSLGPDSKFSDIVFAKPSYLAVQPLNGHPWADACSEEHIAGEPEFTREPIDEQEIYGERRASFFPCFSCNLEQTRLVCSPLPP
jgi:hypothetical protein